MATFEELAQRLKGLNSPLSNNFLFGTVSSLSPLKIKVEGYPELNKSQLILGGNVKEVKITIPYHKHNGTSITESEKEIIIQRGLKVGDKVMLQQSNNKQLFYVMEIIS